MSRQPCYSGCRVGSRVSCLCVATSKQQHMFLMAGLLAQETLLKATPNSVRMPCLRASDLQSWPVPCWIPLPAGDCKICCVSAEFLLPLAPQLFPCSADPPYPRDVGGCLAGFAKQGNGQLITGHDMCSEPFQLQPAVHSAGSVTSTFHAREPARWFICSPLTSAQHPYLTSQQLARHKSVPLASECASSCGWTVAQPQQSTPSYAWHAVVCICASTDDGQISAC